MKHIAVIFRSAPHRNGKAREGLEFALLAANLDQQVSLIFLDEGIFNLLAAQQPELIGNKDYIASFKAVDFYDIEPVLVAEEAMAKFSLTPADLLYPATVSTAATIQQHLQSVDEVLVF
ncbi:sulfurtransferase complex subunit TusC [Shewanella avicenniae]|uniref:Sulfurtransferase complex subunit TusC n=1 Tax=Shewanella avicenniae TaxID=2814294 RepID=A0ABX7QUV6_9GAMM|nr:sulfurtransferase complex subunit TusC [Shewanella avicenniae]QSX35283.1 sulfurtransferase complex subunit TusC [Shewanella avicenniae]